MAARRIPCTATSRPRSPAFWAPTSIKWNFTKFLMDRDGKPVARLRRAPCRTIWKRRSGNYFSWRYDREGFRDLSRSDERRVQDVHERWRDALGAEARGQAAVVTLAASSE